MDTPEPSRTLCFVDTETTGLDPDRHEVWEVAIILRTVDDHGNRLSSDDEFVWQLPVDLSKADVIALNIGRFHERRWEPMGSLDSPLDALHGQQMRSPQLRLREGHMAKWAEMFARWTWGAHMIGCVPSFDTERLGRLLLRHGQVGGWHYQPIDVETLAVGYMLGTVYDLAQHGHGGGMVRSTLERATLPWKSDPIAHHFGVVVGDEDRHTALGDARMARDLWDAVHDRSDIDAIRDTVTLPSSVPLPPPPNPSRAGQP